MTVTTPDRSEQRLVWTLVAVLAVVLAYALAGSTGAGATSVVHWTGVVLLIAGICGAAAGMSATRDERLRLEDQIRRGRERAVLIETLEPEEPDALQVAIVVEPDARRPWNVGLRSGVAAVGSRALRLQWWGVVCLVVGTILTAFW